MRNVAVPIAAIATFLSVAGDVSAADQRECTRTWDQMVALGIITISEERNSILYVTIDEGAWDLLPSKGKEGLANTALCARPTIAEDAVVVFKSNVTNRTVGQWIRGLLISPFGMNYGLAPVGHGSEFGQQGSFRPMSRTGGSAPDQR